MGTYYIDGEFVAPEDAKIPADDLSVLRGYGAFDFLRTYNGVPFELEAHIIRLFRSAQLLLLDMPWTPQEITDIVNETLSKNDFTESNIRIVVTGGTSPSRITPAGKPRLIVMVDPATILPDSDYANGVKLITFNHNRYLPGAKSINYIPAIIALKHAHTQNAIDALFADDNGYVLEGTTNNLFIVSGGKLITTPNDGILPGITRNVVMQIARETYEIEERPILVQQLYNADEAFLTSSVKEVLPIRQVDEAIIGGGAPGEHTKRVMAMFAEYAGVPAREFA
ncbi:MAG: aminotransferase class IV [Aggregatilineales bacterium]